jgi:tRNA A-37 threonylcarbamoyl transferase component Bud32
VAELSQLGRYQLRRVLGKGAMGVVYEGFDPSLNRPVAVKTILKSVFTDEETGAAYSARFVREAKAAARLSHSNIVQVYDFGEQDEVAYLVMEFIQGHELRAFFEARERFDAAETVRIMGELLSALDFAHEAGVIHRDVKPANVMLDAQRRVKLADFGVARMQEGNDRSRGGTIVGTPAFMAPEQISGAKVDRRTDVFSAGIVLYQLLTGEQPFKGEGAWTVAKQIMQDEPPRPSTIATRVSPAFDQIVNRALAKKPDQRFASAKEFSAALQGALAGGSVQRGSDAEIEFWRSIQNSNDPAEYEVYLKEFPAGVYADLARIKIAKLPRIVPGAAPVTAVPASPLAALPIPVRDSSEVLKLAEETARLEAELARREAEHRKREAEAEAKRLADERARAEVDAKREAEATAREAAEEKARLEAIEKARQEAKAELARREAEYRKREAEALARAEAEARTRREIEDRARRDAEARTKAETEARAKARVESAAMARKDAEEQARRDAAIAKREAELRQHESELKAREAAAPRRKLPLVQILIVLVAVIGGAIAAHYWKIASEEAHLAELTSALDAATKATQELSLARQRQEELLQRVEVARLAESDARAKGDQAKLKELQEQTKKAEAEAQKQNELVKQREAEAKKAGDAAKLADAQKQGEAARATEKAALEKAAQAKAAEQTAMEKAAAEKAAAEKMAVDRAAAEKLAAGKALAEKRASEKVAAAKATAASARPGWPSVGDRWVYEAHDVYSPEKKYTVAVEVLEVTSAGVRDVRKIGGGSDIEAMHNAIPSLIYSGQLGALEFLPYVKAFQEIRVGDRWSKFEPASAYCAQFNFTCSASARVTGREQVSVKAGSFDAWKIEVEWSQTSIYGGGAGVAILTYWYAEGVRRFVKYQFRCALCKRAPDTDMELVSYAPASAKVAEKSAALEKASAEGVLPGRYAFRVLPGGGSEPCGRVDVQEDVEIRTGSAQSISGRDFTDLRFQGAQDGSVFATATISNRITLGAAKLSGSATAAGYAGSYDWKFTHTTCTGQWTLVRR